MVRLPDAEWESGGEVGEVPGSIESPGSQHRTHVTVGTSKARNHELPPAERLRWISSPRYRLPFSGASLRELLPDQTLQEFRVFLADAEDATPQPELVLAIGVGRGEQVPAQFSLAIDDALGEPLDGRGLGNLVAHLLTTVKSPNTK